MEDKLVPYYRYVPLKPDFADLLAKLEWGRKRNLKSFGELLIDTMPYTEGI